MYSGKLNAVDDVKYVFCKEHGHKDKNSNKNGMYMPTPHDHAGWLAKILANNTAWKEKNKEAKAAGKRKSTKAIPTSGSPPSNISLSKSFKSALTTQVNLSNAEEENIISRVMAKRKEDSEYASLKD